MNMLMIHPAWPALSFISHLDLNKLAQLLGVIRDPRWYVSLRTPLRGNDIIPYHDDAAKLHAYLGLDPRTMAGVLGLCDETGATDRCRLVLETWSSEEPPQRAGVSWLLSLAAVLPGRWSDQGCATGQSDVHQLSAAGLARCALLRSGQGSASGAGQASSPGRLVRAGSFLFAARRERPLTASIAIPSTGGG